MSTERRGRSRTKKIDRRASFQGEYFFFVNQRQDSEEQFSLPEKDRVSHAETSS